MIDGRAGSDDVAARFAVRRVPGDAAAYRAQVAEEHRSGLGQASAGR